MGWVRSTIAMGSWFLYSEIPHFRDDWVYVLAVLGRYHRAMGISHSSALPSWGLRIPQDVCSERNHLHNPRLVSVPFRIPDINISGRFSDSVYNSIINHFAPRERLLLCVNHKSAANTNWMKPQVLICWN